MHGCMAEGSGDTVYRCPVQEKETDVLWLALPAPVFNLVVVAELSPGEAFFAQRYPPQVMHIVYACLRRGGSEDPRLSIRSSYGRFRTPN